MKNKDRFISFSCRETESLGRRYASYFKLGDVVAFRGEMGSGKTTFLKGVISELASVSGDEIVSPTFSYLHIFEREAYFIYHFDLYRIGSEEDFELAGFGEYLRDPKSYCFIEWAEKIKDKLPQKTIFFDFEYRHLEQRLISVA